MVPGAVDAYLHHVAGELIVGVGKLREPFCRVDDPPVIALELFPVDVTDVAEGLVRADRALVVVDVADVASCSE
jgi:hypothetical protein